MNPNALDKLNIRLVFAALKYRRRFPDLPAGGYVIVYRGEPTEWTRDLDHPKRNRPGCYAISGNATPWVGSIFQATGGNDWDGAEQWSPVVTDATIQALRQ